MRRSVVLGRIAVRSGVALWRRRFTFIGAGVIVAAFGVYQLSFARPSVTNGDCADTAMAAVTHVDESTARAAYACLGPDMRTGSEDQFVASMRQRSTPGGEFARVADKRTNDGGRIVFYTVQSGQRAVVGYIVYLDPAGRVTRVE
jgi:hypothetical protein